ncbi:MAG: hypothetical protein QXT34_03920 [Candidatus Aenigmatarchaeota archaeon]|nr:hypothetical protein [Candidatus Rehaiarchaeum fermentans]
MQKESGEISGSLMFRPITCYATFEAIDNYRILIAIINSLSIKTYYKNDR